MKYPEPGTYTLTYVAIDQCGNESIETRTVVVGVPNDDENEGE